MAVNQTTFKIQKQTQAERDDFLVECFYDGGFIEPVVNEEFSIISGRKGSGKTAIARFLEKKYLENDLFFAQRISVQNIFSDKEAAKDKRESLLFYILIRTVKLFIDHSVISEKKDKRYWNEFLAQNNMQDISDYQTFSEKRRTSQLGVSGGVSLAATFLSKFNVGVNGGQSTESDRTPTPTSPTQILALISQSITNDPIIIFIDDITDYLDDVTSKEVRDDIAIVRDLLLALSQFNLELHDNGKKLRFVSLVRDDLFEFMEGSNINKLKSDSFQIEWDEKSFAGLLVKRLPQFEGVLEDSLKDPIEAIKKKFPNEIFHEVLQRFDTKRYSSNFYAYMVAVTLNRPRDFLRFCYAMRSRLSERGVVKFENIESAEIEYTEYLITEVRDELYLASKLFNYDLSQKRLDQLVDLLSDSDGFNPSQLRAELGQFLGEKTSLGRRKIEKFIFNLWWYGIVGFSEGNKGQLIHYKYMSKVHPFITEKINNYVYFLHRGLWWFTKKRKKE